jgi:F-type H+-transporting ATPase subunit delta
MNGTPRALARRYARALVSVAAERSADEALVLRDDLRDFASLVERSSALRATLLAPTLRAELRRRIVQALAEQAKASALLQRLLLLLAERDRLAILPALAEAFAEQLNAERGVVSAEAVSALPLAAAQQKALAAALGRSAEVEARVDPSVLGGLLVRVGGKTYDGTVRSQLDAMRRRLAGAG